MDSNLIEQFSIQLTSLVEQESIGLKKAFRLLVLKNHPDLGGNPDSYLALQEAFLKLTQQNSHENSAIESDFDGVEYWKYKTPESRLLFHLQELHEWVIRLPKDVFEWHSEVFINQNDIWSGYLKRFFQVLPLLKEDEMLVRSLKSFEDFWENSGYQCYAQEYEIQRLGNFFKDGVIDSLTILKIHTKDFDGPTGSYLKKALEELSAPQSWLGPASALRYPCLKVLKTLVQIMTK